MVEFTEEVELVATKDGTYVTYVFRNLDTRKYVMCTRLPNWKTTEINVGDKGFLKYSIVKAGEEYYDVLTDTTSKFQYSNIYFINFILKNEMIKNNEIIL